MLAQFEHRTFRQDAQMWICSYKQLRNAPHWHLEPEIVGLQEGSAVANLNGMRYELHPGDVLFCPADCVHFLQTNGDSRIIVLQYDQKTFPAFSLQEPCFHDNDRIIQHLNQIYGEYSSGQPWCAEKALALLKCVIIDIIRRQELAPVGATRSRSMKRLDQLVLLLEGDADALDFSAAAQFMNMSEAYFSRFFKKMVGLTFSHYVNVLRIERALDVLAREPQSSMSEVMCQCGFYSLRSFNRVFKEFTGYSPTQLPEGFTLNRRSLVKNRPLFDPTVDAEVLPPA